ncbi:MAG: FAD-dependent oxidoreductase [Sediminicola sp.]|tara:strand:+ start:28847 stop:29929 length:1083 start_codon:yes stop_codon:yes gene_type:complete
MTDYLIVGLGLAGISLCEVLERNNRTFQVVSDTSQTASMVAGGLYNPVNLKRFSLVWNAQEQLRKAMPFYAHLETKLKLSLDQKIPVYRRFASIEEQNMWFEASDTPPLRPFLSSQIHLNTNPHIHAPYGFGEVLQTGRIDTKTLLTGYRQYLRDRKLLREESFLFDGLQVNKEGVRYGDITAKNLVFAMGYGQDHNPFFQYLPLTGTKGELLTIKAADLKERNVIKSSIFVIPLGHDLYRIGATYKWKDKTNLPTAESRAELLDKLNTFLTCDYEVVDHVAGIRPTVTDRRPLVGRHPEIANLYVMNGLGSRGVMIAPTVAEQLYSHIENGTPLDPEMDIARFTKKHFSPSSSRHGGHM